MSRRRYSSDPAARAFVLSLGQRLRELRKQAGLTQTQVALLMGKTGPGGKSHVSQIERGNLPYLTINSVVDYLRATQQSITALADIFDTATKPSPALRQRLLEMLASAPEDERRRALNYYDGLLAKTNKPEKLERLARAAVRQAAAVRQDKELMKVVVSVLDELRIGVRDPLAINIKAYARKLFSILRRTRNSRPAVRERQLAALAHWAEQHNLPPAPFARTKQAVLALFAEMSERGRLD